MHSIADPKMSIIHDCCVETERIPYCPASVNVYVVCNCPRSNPVSSLKSVQHFSFLPSDSVMTKATTMNQLLAALAFITSVVALAPPHPDFQEEFIEHRRRFLKSSVNATSMDPGFLLSPHLCSDLSITECQHMNNLLSRSTTVNLNLLKLKQPIRSLVLLVRFTDHADRKLPSREDVDRLWNSDQLSKQFPTGSIKRYFYRNSYGLMNLEASVMDWLLSDNTELHYSSDKSGLTDEIANSVYPILEQLDREKYDFSRHDMNGDMIIDSLVVSFPAVSYPLSF
jgi:hypothetical protein